ncbi:MAG: BREX-1 system phosphatase PglZ type A [Coprobacillus sp.]|nr:BREX-1 system phosphatase PglZ type A [Coprobacillus sp.]MCI6329738.1 BREX-1 system phosphatase PglZ type A [Erysipelotrichaceae bacterium]
MASIDYQGAKTEIEAIFAQADTQRKIIFWYDVRKDFKDYIIDETFNNCRLLICDRNEFEIKRTIEHEDLTSNFLIYVPSERPTDAENWLLDILMYSQEYYADTVALTMRRLGVTNTDLRKVIENHIKFFDNEARTKKLSNYVEINNNTSDSEFRIAMMAVLTKAAFNTIESILTELVFEGSEHAKYKELVKYRFEDYFWNLVCDNYNYDGDLKIESLIKKFIFTHFIEQTIGQNKDSTYPFDNMPSFYKQFLITGKGVNDAKFFVDRIKTDKRYDELQSSLSLDLKIVGLIATKDISVIQFADTFECLDIDIIEKIASSLTSGSLEFDSFERVIMNRVNSMWYQKHESEYGVLLGTVRFLRNIDKHISIGLSANEYIQKYVKEYYKIDTEYRKVVTYYRNIENYSLEFEQLMDVVENTYQLKFLDVLGPEYSKALSKLQSWEFIGSDVSENFYQKLQRNSAKKMFVIISDALRYEIGYEVYERIKTNKVLKGGVDIDYMISPVPSITSFGMASLLPHKVIEYKGKQVLVDGMTTNSISARDAILKSRNASYAAISYREINEFNQKELRQYCADKSIIYIYHDVMDNAGEHNESKVFDVAESCISEIVNLIKKLYNNLQISNFYITADHGFVYRKNEILESSKYSNIVSLNTVEKAKRYLITDDETISVPYTTEIKLDRVVDGEYRVILPWGYDLFKTQGTGIQYVHGGVSLQETIVPLIHVSELRSRSEVELVRPVGVRLKSITRKITNRSFTLEFEQTEKVEEKKQQITCETYIIDEYGEKVSNEYKFVANSSSDDPATRLTKIRFTLKNIQFDRNKPYFLILKDIESDDYIEKEQFTIDIISFKMF